MNAAELLKERGLSPKKSWGQNFLVDPNVQKKLAQLCEVGPEDRLVIEIGAGTGALTEMLVGSGAPVLAIERDRDLAALLRDRFALTPGLSLIETNALDFDLAHAAAKAGGRVKLVGNLPYHLSAPILFMALDARASLCSAHFLLQKEVALRLCAGPREEDYSLLSVLTQRVAKASLAAQVSRHCFFPKPQVDSAFVSLRFLENPPGGALPDAFFTAFVKAAFSKRRKTLMNSLRQQGFLHLSDDALQALAARFPERLKGRAEELSVAQFVEMAEVLWEKEKP